METEYKCNTKFFLELLFSEMETYSKEELEGIKKCIEEDKNVTHPISEQGRMAFKDVICTDAAILTYLKADLLLNRLSA